MWNIFTTDREECSRFRDALENTRAQSPELRIHLGTCAECREAAEEFQLSQELLRHLPSRAADLAPWFAAHVMNAIATREAELRRSLETWSIVPKLAARLSGVSALALLLAGTWLYQRPRTASPSRSPDTSAESLFDGPSSSQLSDDILASHSESE